MYDSSSCHALSPASQLTAAFPSAPARRLFSFLSTILVLAALIAAPSALAAQHQLTLDCEASDVAFLLEATGHDVEGHLHLASGTLNLEPGDAAAGGVASGELVLDATATETGNRRRDKKMHKEVLISQLHPRIVFHPERYEGTFPGDDGEGELQLLGTVELLGASHPLTLTVSYKLADEHFDADVTFDVPFIDWGLEDPSILFLRVDNVVHVNAKVQGSWTAAERAAASPTTTTTGEPATAITEGR